MQVKFEVAYVALSALVVVGGQPFANSTQCTETHTSKNIIRQRSIRPIDVGDEGAEEAFAPPPKKKKNILGQKSCEIRAFC